MRKNILAQFKNDLRTAVENFEKENGGRHNRRLEVSKALDTLEEYIHRAHNPLILLNMIEIYIKNYLTGFLKSFFFRDEYQLKKHLQSILTQPEYSLASLSHSLYHENEVEKLGLYRLISQLEERLRSVESGKEDASFESIEAHGSSDFDDLRAKISHLEEYEKQAHIKISDLENEKWIKEREIIELQAKIQWLSTENGKLQARNQALQEALDSIHPEHQKSREKNGLDPEKSVKKFSSQLIYQNNYEAPEKTSSLNNFLGVNI